MAATSSFLFSTKNKTIVPALMFLLGALSLPSNSAAQINVGLIAVATQSGGGVTIYSPANYNDNVIVGFTGCSGYGTCPTPWGWVNDGGTITYTWSAAVTFNKVVFYHADRPMTSCTVQYWNGSGWTTIAPYTTAICQADSMLFAPVTTTILQFVNCRAPLINPNFREIQVWQSGPPPPTIAGATHYCTGDIITLTASSTSTSPTFSWTGPSAFTATTPTITLTASPATAGVYSCTVTSGGYTSAPRLDTIVVVPPPDITLGIVPNVCQGATFANLPYSAPISGPTNYSIVYSPAAITAGFINVTGAALPASPIVLSVPAGVASGAYTGTLTVNNGSCSGPGALFTVNVNPNPAPITGSTNICTGSTTTLSDATAGGTWSSSNPGVATIGSTSGLATGVTIGATVITYSLTSTGCYRTTVVNVVGISGPDHVCAGDSITLVPTTAGGIWSSGDITLASVNAVTGVVTGVAMGIVPISYTVSSGCLASWTITVNPHAPIVGRDSVCKGSIRWLTNVVGGGIWSSTFPAVATILPDSGKLTGVLAGITTISYLLPTGCWSAVSFSVIDYPTAITGVKQVCPGASTGLGNAVPGGAWASENPAVAIVDPTGGVVTGVFADTVDITYTIEPGCQVFTRVTVNPLPAPITGTNAMCPGTVDTLKDATRSGTWTSGSTPIATIDTGGVISAVTQGLATIKYTLPTGCFMTKTISVDPIPVPWVAYDFAIGSFVAEPGFASYQWYDSIQGKIPGATSQSIAALNTEYYYVEVTDSVGCKGNSIRHYFDESQLGISNIANAHISIYPNPASAVLFIASAIPVKAVISSIEGRNEILQENAKEIDISRLPNGIYLVTLFDVSGTRIAIQKLVKG